MDPSPCPLQTCSLNVSNPFAEFGIVLGKVLIDIIMEVTCRCLSGKLWPHPVSWWKWCLAVWGNNAKHPGNLVVNSERQCQCWIWPCACKGVIPGMCTDQDPLLCSSETSLNEHKLAAALKDVKLSLSFVLATGAGWPGSEWVQLRANPVNKRKGKKSQTVLIPFPDQFPPYGLLWTCPDFCTDRVWYAALEKASRWWKTGWLLMSPWACNSLRGFVTTL